MLFFIIYPQLRIYDLHLHLYLCMNLGSLWSLYLAFRSPTPLFWVLHSRDSFSPGWVCRSDWYIGTLELVYFSISKKSLMTVTFLLRKLLPILVSSCGFWFVLEDCCIPNKASHIFFWMESPVDRLVLPTQSFYLLLWIETPAKFHFLIEDFFLQEVFGSE